MRSLPLLRSARVKHQVIGSVKVVCRIVFNALEVECPSACLGALPAPPLKVALPAVILDVASFVSGFNVSATIALVVRMMEVDSLILLDFRFAEVAGQWLILVSLCCFPVLLLLMITNLDLLADKTLEVCGRIGII